MFELVEFLGAMFEILHFLAWPFKRAASVSRARLARRKERLRSLAAPPPSPASPVARAFGFAVLGAIAGVGSLLIFPDILISDARLRLASLILAPVLSGLVTAVFGSRNDPRGEKLLRLDLFSYGFVAILTMGLLRALVAK